MTGGWSSVKPRPLALHPSGHGATGYLLWIYRDDAPAGKCGYEFGPTSALIEVFREFRDGVTAP